MTHDENSSMNWQKLPGVLLLFVLVMLGLIGVFSRWPSTDNVLRPAGLGLTFSSLTSFPQNYESRFNTNFKYRDRLIHLDYQTRYFVLNEKVFPQVLIGKQGWMYYTGEGNLDYFQRVKPLDGGQLESTITNLIEIQQRLEEQGITFLFVIAPNKETVYPEFLPDDINSTDKPSWADQIIAGLEGRNVKLLDLRPPLIAEKSFLPVYFKTDTHWNPVGAHLAYTKILKSLQPDFPNLLVHPITDFDQVAETSSGDLAGLIHLKGEITEPFTALHARFDKPSLGLKNPPSGQMITIMPDRNLPTAVIFRDSFFNGLQPFTSEHFYRVVYVSDFFVNFDLIAEENPQIVILEVAERYLDRLAK